MLHSACTSKVLNHIAKTLPKCCICSTVGYLNPNPFRFPNWILKLDFAIHPSPEHNGLGLKRSKMHGKFEFVWSDIQTDLKKVENSANIWKKPTVCCPTLFKPGWIWYHSCVWMNKQGNERNFVKSASVHSKLLARPVLSYCICKLTLHYIWLFTTVSHRVWVCNWDQGVFIPRGPHSPWSSWIFHSTFSNDSPIFLSFIWCSPRSPRNKIKLILCWNWVFVCTQNTIWMYDPIILIFLIVFSKCNSSFTLYF